jgi:hypothetical protein
VPPPPACVPSDPAPAPRPVAAPDWNCGDRCFQSPQVTGPAEPMFNGAPADPVAANVPALIYPLAGSLHPINLRDITFQWRRAPGADQRLFRLRMVPRAFAAERPWDFYVPCASPDVAPPPPAESCVFVLPDRAWRTIAVASRGAEVAVTIAGRDVVRQVVATSPAVTVAFSPAAVEGGLHYLVPDTRELRRHVFGGGAGSTSLVPPRSAANPFACAGCHAVSRDGATIAFAAEYEGQLGVTPTANPGSPLIVPRAGVFDAIAPALSRDGVLVLGRAGPDGRVTVRRVANGQVVAAATRDELGGRLHFPEWSPDGREIVATRSTNEMTHWSALDGELVVIPFADNRLGAPRPLVREPAGDMHLYPTWSPDGGWIAFASAPRGGESFNNRMTRLRLVARTGGTIHELAQATQAAGKGATYPKFAPGLQASCNLMFLTFASRLDYGYLRRNSVLDGGGLPQLWLAAIDLRKLPAGDPSSAPVWLPFQDLARVQTLATWSDRVPCTSAATCGPSTSCTDGLCTPAD